MSHQRLMLFTVTAVICALALPAQARARAEPGSMDADDLVASLATEFGVTLDEAGAELWTTRELRSIWRGLHALPRQIVREHAPIAIARSNKKCLFGMGRYSEACPTWTKGSAFIFYDTAPVTGTTSSARTYEPLRASEREDLQRRRAAVHMIMARHDATHDWSERRTWRLINTWDGSGKRSFNVDDWAFSRYLGSRSAHFDLVTFAEEFFARPEDVLATSVEADAPERLASIDPNLSLACQAFTKIRILKTFVHEVAPEWAEPARNSAKLPVACPQFEQWADMPHVEGIDLLLAAATSERPESLYGHLLMAVRYSSEGSMRSRGFEPVYQYGAITDTDVDKVTYFSKGLFGGFYSIIQPNTFRGTDRLFMQYEQRTLRRYALNLSPKELRQVMERIWEAERHVTFQYFFLSDNCASMLIDLLAPALDVELPDILRVALMPTEVLDHFASVQSPGRGPLLVKRAETHFSSREVAMDAVPKRRAALTRLLKRLRGVDDTQRDAIRAIAADLDARDASTRSKAFERMRGALLAALRVHAKTLDDPSRVAGPGSVSRDAVDYLYYSSRVERYFMDVAFYEKRSIFAGAQREPLILTVEEQMEMRRDLFDIEDLQQRQEAMLAFAQLADDRLRHGPRRPFTEYELERLSGLERTRAVYSASLDALATIIETFDPELDGVTYIEDKTYAFEAEQSRRDAQAMGPPGKGRYVVGAGGGNVGSAAFTGWVDLSASMIYERLGEQRRRGFRSDIESRALGIDAELRLGEDLLDALKLDGVIFRFLTIEQLLGPVRSSWRDAFGWGVDLRYQRDRRRGMNSGVALNLGWLYPIFTSDHVANHLVAGLFLDANPVWADTRNPGYVGVKAALIGQRHMYGRYANVLRLNLETRQLADLRNLQYDWAVHGTLSTDHVLADINQQLLIMRPYVEGEVTSMQFREDAERGTFAAWRAGVRFELPF